VSKDQRSVRVRMKIPPDLAAGVYRLHASRATVPVAFVVSENPEITVTGESARRKQDPVPVQLPVTVNGVLDKPRAADYFSFQVETAQTVNLSVDSMQLGFQVDPLVAIYDESGKRIAFQDDPTPPTGTEPTNLDPHLVVQLPKAGRYVAMVRDSEFRGNPNFVYRFTLKPAEPDFTLKVLGTDETLFRGRENIVTVRVRRLAG